MGAQKKTYLLFDRYWIANHHDWRKAKGEYCFKVCPPTKPDLPFLYADKPWESFTIGYGTLIYEQGLYRLWYEAYDDTYKFDNEARLCYAESSDGIHWKKPNLGRVDFHENKENNIVFDGRMSKGLGLHGHCVFIDPNSPPEARYRMIFTGLASGQITGEYFGWLLSFAYSADGIQWHWGIPEFRDSINPPVAGFGGDGQTVAYWDADRRCYICYTRKLALPGRSRAIGRAITADFGRWPIPDTILTIDEKDPFGIDLYNNAASRYTSGSDVAHFLFISVFDYVADTLNIQLATSRDGVRYNRLDRSPFLENGQTFDRGSIYMCPGVHTINNELVMAYLATDYKHGEAVPDKNRYKGSFALLRFPKDRFQGLSTDSNFEFNIEGFRNREEPFTITLNADIKKQGRIRAGLITTGGEIGYLKGFSPDECEPLIGNGTDLKLRWKGGHRITENNGAPIELRIFMEKSILYCIYITA